MMTLPNLHHIIIVVTCRGSVIAKIVGNNVLHNDKFVKEVPMYVYEEMVDGQKLTEIINTKHENIKYLPGCILPDNVVSIEKGFMTMVSLENVLLE